MKKFVLGFLCAALLFTAIPVGAAVQDYVLKLSAAKIVVDGAEFKDEGLPILYLDPGYNYVPAAVFRDICDKIGVGFKYDSAAKEIQIDTKSATVKTDELTNTKIGTGGDIVSDMSTPALTDVPLNKYGLPDFSNYNGEWPLIEDNGTDRFFSYEGVAYISITAPPNRSRILSDPYFFRCPVVDNKVSHEVQLVKDSQLESTVLIDEIPYALYGSDRDYYVQYDYYLNEILPLTQERFE